MAQQHSNGYATWSMLVWRPQACAVCTQARPIFAVFGVYGDQQGRFTLASSEHLNHLRSFLKVFTVSPHHDLGGRSFSRSAPMSFTAGFSTHLTIPNCRSCPYSQFCKRALPRTASCRLSVASSQICPYNSFWPL